jgi:DNA-binding protein Fis
LAALEREVLAAVLRHTGGNQVQAAKVLGISRNSVRAKTRALGLTIERPTSALPDPSTSLSAGMVSDAAGVAAGTGWGRFVRERLEARSHSLYAESLVAMERHLLTGVLQHTRGNQLQAAKILGISRNSVRAKIRALGITIEQSVCPADDQGDPAKGSPDKV